MKIGVSILAALFTAATSFGERAVSGPNGKIGGFAGDMNGETGYNLEGSFSLPIGEYLGVQFDGLYTDVSDREFYGAGTHLFWRNPEVGLVGLTGGLMQERDILTSWSAGAEAEYYWKRLTFQASGGRVNIEYDYGPLPFIDTDKTDYYATGGLGVYVLEDLLLSASYTQSMGNGLGRGLLEYQTPVNGLSLFGDVAVGENDYDHAMLGIRYYFGKTKPLIHRHREDDPQNLMHMMMYNIGTYGSEFNQAANDYIEKVIEEAGLTGIVSAGSVTVYGASGIAVSSSGSYGATVFGSNGYTDYDYRAVAEGGTAIATSTSGGTLINSGGGTAIIIHGGLFVSGTIR